MASEWPWLTKRGLWMGRAVSGRDFWFKEIQLWSPGFQPVSRSLDLGGTGVSEDQGETEGNFQC